MEGADTLSGNDCFGFLARQSLGRVAYTERALPAIWPVPYVLVNRHLILRTHRADLAARLDGQIVAFEVDDLDADGEGVWIVVVTGLARILAAPAEPAGHGEVTSVQITPGDVRGRRVLRTLAVASDAHPAGNGTRHATRVP